LGKKSRLILTGWVLAASVAWIRPIRSQALEEVLPAPPSDSAAVAVWPSWEHPDTTWSHPGLAPPGALDLDGSAGYRIWDVLDVLPPFSIARDGYYGDQPTLHLLGLGFGATEFELDDVPLNRYSTGEADLNLIPLVGVGKLSMGTNPRSGLPVLALCTAGAGEADTSEARTKIAYMWGGAGRKAAEMSFRRFWSDLRIELSSGQRKDGPHGKLERFLGDESGGNLAYRHARGALRASYWKASSSTRARGGQMDWTRRQGSLGVFVPRGATSSLTLSLYDVEESREYSGPVPGLLDEVRRAATMGFAKRYGPRWRVRVEASIEHQRLEQDLPAGKASGERDRYSFLVGSELSGTGSMLLEGSLRSILWRGGPRRICPRLRISSGEKLVNALEVSAGAAEQPAVLDPDGLTDSYLVALSQSLRSSRFEYRARVFASSSRNGYALVTASAVGLASPEMFVAYPRNVLGFHSWFAFSMSRAWRLEGGLALARTPDGSVPAGEPAFKAVTAVSGKGSAFGEDLRWRGRFWTKFEGRREAGVRVGESFWQLNGEIVLTILGRADFVVHLRNLNSVKETVSGWPDGKPDITFALNARLED